MGWEPGWAGPLVGGLRRRARGGRQLLVDLPRRQRRQGRRDRARGIPAGHTVGPGPCGDRVGGVGRVVPAGLACLDLRRARPAPRDLPAALSVATRGRGGRGRGHRRRPTPGEHRAPVTGDGAALRGEGAAGGPARCPEPRVMTARLAIIGAGAWGTALALQAARAGHAPRLWVFEPQLLGLIRDSHENAWYLPGIRLPERVTPVGSL